MLACVDVHYTENEARAGCLLFETWTAATPSDRIVVTTPVAAEYSPGEFFRRELPPLRAVLARVAVPLEVVVVDGYVWLAGKGAGVGAHLHAALGEKVTVVGVAKTVWSRPGAGEQGTAHAVVEVVRGASRRPLYVTAAGVGPDTAAGWVRKMHGAHRMPTLLKAVDALVRTPPIASRG